MFRILTAEDDPPTSKFLCEEMVEQIHDVHVDLAVNVPEAHEFIDRAIKNHQPYDVVVLDIMLPAELGKQASLDETICLKLRERMRDTLVAHITFYQDDDDVKKHLERVHGPSQIDFSFSLAKVVDEITSVTWSSQLLAKLKSFLYDRRIDQQLKALFGDGGFSEHAGARTRASNRITRSRTHELASLTRNISSDWSYLSSGLQTRIQDIFKVVENPDGEVRVSLF